MQNLVRPPGWGGLAEEIFRKDSSRPLKIAAVVALVFHVLLFFVVLPRAREPVYADKDVLVNILPLAPPPAPAEKEGVKKVKPAIKKSPTVSKAKTFIPFPDPTPDAPEPLTPPLAETPVILVEEVHNELEIGEIIGPPLAESGGKGRQGTGPGSRTGPGGTGENIYKEGTGGVSPPVLLDRATPLYTEEARRRRVEGLVILRAVIDKSGRITDVQIIKSLDPGLDESAVKTVMTKWRFRPATLNDQPVLFEITFEISFRLF